MVRRRVLGTTISWIDRLYIALDHLYLFPSFVAAILVCLKYSVASAAQ